VQQKREREKKKGTRKNTSISAVRETDKLLGGDHTRMQSRTAPNRARVLLAGAPGVALRLARPRVWTSVGANEGRGKSDKAHGQVLVKRRLLRWDDENLRPLRAHFSRDTHT